MALIDINVYSEVLGEHRPIRVILPTPTSSLYPQEIPYYQGKKYQTLYLLHGATGDQTVWTRYSKIEWYAQKNQLAVVMAAANNSSYVNMKHGLNYYTFFTEELPKIVQNILPLSKKREDNFIAGISMGGYGTWRIGLGCPEKFAAMAILSSSILRDEMNRVSRTGAAFPKRQENTFGSEEELMNSDNNTARLLRKRVEEGAELPAIYMACGTEDFLYSSNLHTKQLLEELKVPFTYSEGPGVHDWTFWDEEIRKVVDWLPLKHNLVD